MSSMNTIEQIIRWIVLGIGVLTAVYGLVVILSEKPTNGRARIARGLFVWPNIVSGVLMGVIVIAILRLVNEPKLLTGIAIALPVGWALMFALFFASRTAGRKLASEGSLHQTSAGYRVLSASGLLSSAVALLGAVIALLLSHSFGADRMLPVAILLTSGLGFWLAATFWSLPAALYRSLLMQDEDVSPADLGSLCVQFRSAPGEMGFMAATALVGAAAIALYRFPAEDVSGQIYPLAVYSAALLFGLLASPLLKPHDARAGIRLLLWSLGIIVFIVGSGAAAWYLAASLLYDARAFYCYGTGLATAMLLMLTARYRPPFTHIGAPLGLEVAVGQVLMVLASSVLAFRWMAGYGVALCATGLLSSFAVLFSVGALWAALRTGEDTDTDMFFMAHAASRFAEIVMAGGAFVLTVLLIRLFAERAALGRAGIDITEPYPLIGLVIGGSFPIVLRAMSQSGKVTVPVASFDRSVLLKLGRWTAYRGIQLWLLAALTPPVVAFFWRTEAAGAFLVGLAAAQLFLILTLWLGEVRNSTDEGTRLTTRSTHILAVGSGLVTALVVPPLIDLTGGFSREARIWSLVALFAILFLFVLVIVWRRLSAAERT